MSWQPLDLRGDPDALEHHHDPALVLEALAEILTLADGPAWHTDAACRNQPGVTWFPERGQDVGPARELCATCPVRRTCLAGAIERNELYGIWCGTSAKQRKEARRKAPGDVVGQVAILLGGERTEAA